MIKVIFNTMTGIFITISGFYVAYLYLRGVEDGTSPLFLGLSLLLVSAGVFLLTLAGKSNDSIAMAPDKDASNLPLTPEGTGGFQKVLEKNNSMVDEWSNTMDKRDKLKLLEIQATVEKGNS